MCYLHREFERQRKAAPQPAEPSDTRLPLTRPRMAGALAAVLIGLAAAVAVLWPSATPALPKDTAVQPPGIGIEQTAVEGGDGIPPVTELARNVPAMVQQHCDHDL